ncbi:hypothetical protein ACWGQ5_50110 [Streptomyces sp. NPDC055722]
MSQAGHAAIAAVGGQAGFPGVILARREARKWLEHVTDGEYGGPRRGTRA